MDVGHATAGPPPRTVTMVSAKGGVGKSASSSGVATGAAISGLNVLLVDLDPQGDAGLDVGVPQKRPGDEGQNLLAAITGDAPLSPLRAVRPNLDLAVGGPRVEGVPPLVQSGAVPLTALRSALAQVAEDYDVIVIDTPPRTHELQDLALAATRFVVIPIRSDRGSLEGITRTAARFSAARAFNPKLELLGIFLFASNPNASRIHDMVRERIVAGLGDDRALLETVVRYSEATAIACREDGISPYEYEAMAASTLGKGPRLYSAAGGKLAGDYARLTSEVLRRMTDSLRGDPDLADDPEEAVKAAVDAVAEVEAYVSEEVS